MRHAPTRDLDDAIALAQRPGVTVATFGDMMRVPGTRSSACKRRAPQGADVRIVYSALDALAAGANKPERAVVMLGIGFETTAPTVAASVVQAQEQGLRNYYVLLACTSSRRRPCAPSWTRARCAWMACSAPATSRPSPARSAWEFLAREYRRVLRRLGL